MKINPTGKTYQQIKEQFKQKFAQSKKEVQERLKEAKNDAFEAAGRFDEKINDARLKEKAQKATDWVEDRFNDAKKNTQKAADWTGERVEDIKDAYARFKQQYAGYTMPSPKLETLGREIKELQKSYLFKSAILGGLKQTAPEQTMLIYRREKELQQLEQQVQAAIEKYNRFASRQAAAQKAFDLLNNNI